MKKLFLLLTLSVFSIGALAQSNDFLWAKQIGGTNDDHANSIAIDTFGNVYTTGWFSGTVDFNPGVGVFNLTALAGSVDFFISKLDNSGNFIWAKAMGGTSAAVYCQAIVVDDLGNVYTTGGFSGTVDFNPDAGIFNISSTGGYLDIFISKLNSSGNFVWAKAIGGTSDDHCFSISLDATNNIYTTGGFSGTVDFNPGAAAFNLTSTGGNNIFISKLNSSGNFVWAKSIGGTNSSSGGRAIIVNGFGDVYTTGHFRGTADFDPNGGVYNLSSYSIGSDDIFICKLDSTGNLLWAKSFGGIDDDDSYSIALDNSGNVYTTGYFWETVDFDPSIDTFILIASFTDIFISKFNGSGNFIWAKAIGGTDVDGGNSIAVDTSGNVYTTGYFGDTTDFDPDSSGHFYSISNGSTDIFISKLDSDGNFVRAKSIGGTWGDWGYSLAVDDSGYVYLTGLFQSSTISFDTTVLTNSINNGTYDFFVAKLLLCNTAATINLIACDSYISPSGNYIWNNSGTHLDTIPNAAGCDSVIAINLTIINSTTSTQSITTCDNYISPSGFYSWTSSGSYLDTIPNAIGCDSIITINLTIINSTSSSDSVTTCFNYISPSGNYTWTTSGTYLDTIPNTEGCDSVITINLTINSVDNSVTQSGVTLISNDTSAAYQWLNCNNNFSIINGATNQTFTATVNGNYAVEVTQNGCTDTSFCLHITGCNIIENILENKFEIFPNPTEGNIIIQFSEPCNNCQTFILNQLGQQLYSEIFNQKSQLLNLKSLSQGIYFMRIQMQDGNVIVRKIVKE